MEHEQDNVQETSADDGNQQVDDGNQKAVARVKIHLFHETPERIFYLFKGLNYVGRDPSICNVWLPESYICRIHLAISKQKKHDKQFATFSEEL
jgi:hypothetical protein